MAPKMLKVFNENALERIQFCMQFRALISNFSQKGENLSYPGVHHIPLNNFMDCICCKINKRKEFYKISTFIRSGDGWIELPF